VNPQPRHCHQWYRLAIVIAAIEHCGMHRGTRMTICTRRNTLKSVCLGLPALLVTRQSACADELQDGGFRSRVIALLARRHPDWTVVPEADPAMMTIASTHISLNNLYLRVRGMPSDQREEEIVSFVENSMQATRAGAAADNVPYPAAEGRLRLQIVPDEYKRAVQDLVCRPFFEGLSVDYALDDAKSYQLLRQPTLDGWHVGQDEIEARAIANLEAASVSVPLEAKRRLNQRAYAIVNTSDGYDAVRLLLPNFMARLRATLEAPRVFVGIPSRDFLVAWTPDFAGRKGFALKLREDAVIRNHPLTDMLFSSSEAGVALATPEEMSDHGRGNP
jgi:uncharacterized protein YtpQ (UPF0354 family)